MQKDFFNSIDPEQTLSPYDLHSVCDPNLGPGAMCSKFLLWSKVHRSFGRGFVLDSFHMLVGICFNHVLGIFNFQRECIGAGMGLET